MLASGQLGKHHGLPATLIVSTTLAELGHSAKLGVTAGGTVPGYGCRAHHAVLDWTAGGLTNTHFLNDGELAFACPTDNKLLTEGGWTTRNNPYGDTEWIPPAHLDVGQPRVNDHHPEQLRRRPESSDPVGHPGPVLPHRKSGDGPPNDGQDDDHHPVV